MECVESISNGDGTRTVVVSSATCKEGTISWMCCIGASGEGEGVGICDVDNSQPGCEADKEKCEGVDLLTMVVAEGTTSVTIQVCDCICYCFVDIALRLLYGSPGSPHLFPVVVSFVFF